LNNVKLEKIRFVLIDETIVDRGWWASVSGIALTQFRKNPIMYWMHQRPSSYDGKNQMLPIGKWEDVKVELVNGIKAITATPIFDEKDEFAVKIKSKVEGGFIKMASAGLQPITWSDDKKYLKPGQTRATLLKSEMREASIVDMGANKNAIRLYDENGIINLSDNNETDFIPLLNTNKKEFNMKLIALKLGLKEDATEIEILAEIENLRKSESESKDAVQKLNADKVEKLMKHKSITDENRADFQELAETNFQLAEKTLSQMEGVSKQDDGQKEERLSDALKNKKGDNPKSDKKNWDDFTDEELSDLRENHQEEYIPLFEKEFGSAPILK